MTLDMIGQLLGETRKEFGGKLPPPKPIPGQIPTPETVKPGSGGHLDPKKVLKSIGDAPLPTKDDALGVGCGADCLDGAADYYRI